MKVLVVGESQNNNQEILEPNSLIRVEIDLSDMDGNELVDYCVGNLSVTRDEDIDIDLIDDDVIKEYAEDMLDMVEKDDVNLFDFTKDEIKDHLCQFYDTVIDKPFYYPNNSIRMSAAYEKLLDNIDKIPIEEIEKLTKNL